MTLWSQVATTRIVATLNSVEYDITPYVLTVGSLGQRVSSYRGRQTQLSRMDPSRFSMRLNNMDCRFTPGNASSPYFPYWRMGAPVRWTETIGPRTFTHFDGFIEMPEMEVTFQSATVNDSTVTVNAVDTLTWLGRQRPFVSTLGAYIQNNGGDLSVYYPMNDAAVPFHSVVGGGLGVVKRQSYTSSATPPASTPEVDVVFPASVQGPAGEDVSFVRFVPVIDTIGSLIATPSTVAPINVAVSSGQTVALSVWANGDAVTNAFQPSSQIVRLAGPTNIFPYLNIAEDYLGELVQTSAYDESAVSSVTVTSTGALERNAWRLITTRLTLPTGAVDLWVGQTRIATGTMSGTPPTSLTFEKLTLSDSWVGAVGHVQVRVGVDVFTHADHVAQCQAGFHGLERQTTGARIRTILGYAGVAESAMDGIDTGSSMMSVASLAGKTALEAMQEAATTEQGRLFSAGDGSTTFHDRHRIYNT